MKYFIREALDTPIVGIYEDVYEAAKNCDPGFKVYDENGNVMIGTLKIGKENTSTCKLDAGNAWKDLKEYYQNNLDSIKEIKETLGKLPFASEVVETIYEEILSKMEEIEKKNTIIWEDH